MAESRGPAGTPEPAPGSPAAAGAGGRADIDPVAVIRSRRYLSALILSGILGIPISAVAYGFLALVAKIQSYLFDELPTQVTGGPAPAWWPLPWLVLCGLLTALTIRYLPRVSHWVQQEAPETVNAMIEAFLRGRPVPYLEWEPRLRDAAAASG